MRKQGELKGSILEIGGDQEEGIGLMHQAI